jgi:hypothetical protein
MGAWILALAFGVLGVADERHGEQMFKPLPRNSSVLVQRIATVCCRAFGRLMAMQIRNGMTSKEADSLLGDFVVEEGQFLNDRIVLVLKRYGFIVVEEPDQERRWRVTDVRLLPLFSID